MNMNTVVVAQTKDRRRGFQKGMNTLWPTKGLMWTNVSREIQLLLI